MRNFSLFRRKSALQVSPKNVDEPQEAPEQSILSEGQKIEGSDLNKLLNEVMYQKLKLIFSNNPQLQKYITLYNYSKSLPNNYQESRQQILKKQISQGLDQVLKLEERYYTHIDKNENYLVEKQFSNFLYLIRPKKDLRKAIFINHELRSLYNQINGLTSVKLNRNKNLVVYLISLLTSLDAIPPISIPVINFGELTSSKERIANEDAECKSLLNDINRLDHELKRQIERISMFKCKYDDTTPDDHISRYHAILSSFYDQFNRETQLFVESPQILIFHDYVAHPKIISSPFFLEFKTSITPESLKKFVDDIIDLYRVTDDNDKIITYLLASLSYIPDVVDPFSEAPQNVKIDAAELNNEEMEKYFDLAFEVFITIDPVEALMVIAKFIERNEGVKSTEKDLRFLSLYLQMFTPKWKDLLGFIVIYSIPEFLPPSLLSIRRAIYVNIN